MSHLNCPPRMPCVPYRWQIANVESGLSIIIKSNTLTLKYTSCKQLSDYVIHKTVSTTGIGRIRPKFCPFLLMWN